MNKQSRNLIMSSSDRLRCLLFPELGQRVLKDSRGGEIDSSYGLTPAGSGAQIDAGESHFMVRICRRTAVWFGHNHNIKGIGGEVHGWLRYINLAANESAFRE